MIARTRLGSQAGSGRACIRWRLLVRIVLWIVPSARKLEV